MIIACLGQACLGLALLAAAAQALGFKTNLYSRELVWGQVFFMTLAFALLTCAHITDQFSLLSVALHSHTHKPLLYKITGVWGNHEGSMLLWVFILSVYSALLVRQLHNKEPAYHLAIPVVALINFSFILFLIVGCDPFTTLNPVPLEGQDLNPLLQDFSLAIHPPCLYLGTVGFTVPFVFAALVVIHGKMPESWAGILYPWVLWAWTFLTLGLGLGSFWAYYELGWGGWWFWDPVENAALMPWLSATALVHGLRAYMVTATLRVWTLFLCILTFALCLAGMFLVRSGMLTSVHSFAVDAERGIFLLVISCFLILPVTGLLTWRSCLLRSVQTTLPFSRAGLIVIMTLFLICGTLTIATGTLYPLVMEIFGLKITVGEPWFRATFIPMMLPALFMTGLGSWALWNEEIPVLTRNRLLLLFLVILIALTALYLTLKFSHLLGLCALAGAIWTIVATLIWAVKNKKQASGMIYAHIGIGVAVLGIVGSSLGEQEVVSIIQPGQKFFIGPHSLTLQNVSLHEGPNYHAQTACFQLDSGKKVLKPEKRFYWTQDIIHGESAIQSIGLHHVYLTLGEEYEGQRWSVHAYYKPFINLLGIGTLMIVAGGILAFTTRRSCATIPCIFLLLFTGLSLSPLEGVEASEQLQNPVLEKRARLLGQKILCPECGGQLLDESPVKAARDLRYKIRQALKVGQTDQQILNDLVARYGPQIITQPPCDKSTLVLWLLPWLIFTGGTGLILKKFITRKSLKL